MQYVKEGLAAYEAQQYSEALLYFQQALPHIESPAEQERVLMWIACSSLAIGHYETLLSACPSLLGSEDAHVRRFARAILKQVGMLDPDHKPAVSMLKSATDQYFTHFWALQSQNFQALLWLVSLGILVFAWSIFALDRQYPQMPTFSLQNAQKLWWVVVLYVPPGIALVICVERSKVAIQSQKVILQKRPLSNPQGRSQAIGILCLTVGLFGSISWFHLPLGCLLGICLEPWWICLVLHIWPKK